MFPRTFSRTFPRFAVLLAPTLLALACGKSDDNCPGLCPDENVLPSMTIVTSDGAATIASARVRGGPCTHLLTHSLGEVGAPTGYAAVQVFYNPGTARLDQSGGVAPLCNIEVTSLWGDVEAVGVQVKAKPYTKTCCPYGTCCPKTQDAPVKRYQLEFDQATQTVSFLPGLDGGTGDDAGPVLDGGLDSSRVDGEDIDATEFDAEGIDGGAIDATGIDSASIDTAELDVASGT